MITVRIMERLWGSQAYGRVVHELLGQRAEASALLASQLAPKPAAAALLLIRLDELSQSHVPLYAKLVHSLVEQQQADGGWTDLMTTALCTRALLCGSGGGFAVEGALGYLASLQKEDGSWPVEPFRRMPADPHVSAFILSQLADRPEFVEAVQYGFAWDWLDRRQNNLDNDTRKLWHLAHSRDRFAGAVDRSPLLLGS